MAARTAAQRRSSSAVEIGVCRRSESFSIFIVSSGHSGAERSEEPEIYPGLWLWIPGSRCGTGMTILMRHHVDHAADVAFEKALHILSMVGNA